MRNQVSFGKSFDLVTTICDYLTTLQQTLDSDGMDDAVQALESLVEFTQGPCRENQSAVVKAKVIEACSNILTWDDKDLVVIPISHPWLSLYPVIARG